jgi:hypothetical protein
LDATEFETDRKYEAEVSKIREAICTDAFIEDETKAPVINWDDVLEVNNSSSVNVDTSNTDLAKRYESAIAAMNQSQRKHLTKCREWAAQKPIITQSSAESNSNAILHDLSSNGNSDGNDVMMDSEFSGAELNNNIPESPSATMNNDKQLSDDSQNESEYDKENVAPIDVHDGEDIEVNGAMNLNSNSNRNTDIDIHENAVDDDDEYHFSTTQQIKDAAIATMKATSPTHQHAMHTHTASPMASENETSPTATSEQPRGSSRVNADVNTVGVIKRKFNDLSTTDVEADVDAHDLPQK